MLPDQTMDETLDETAKFDPADILKRLESETRLPSQAMVDCPKCGKKNPANRLSCFYCVAELPVSSVGTSKIKLNLRKLEPWESGFNVLVKSVAEFSDQTEIARLAGTAGLSVEVMERILQSRILMPIARVESLPDAEYMVETAESAGLISMSVPDTDLSQNEPPVRLWQMELRENAAVFVTFNRREAVEIPYTEMMLCICGQINETRSETSNKFKKGKAEVIDELATATDKFVADIYTSDEPRGFRISTAGFDFSVLGAGKSMLAAKNLEQLVSSLAERSSTLRIDRKYGEVKNLLNEVWERENSDQTYGLRIAGIGKRKVDRVATSNNELQFLKYARSRIF